MLAAVDMVLADSIVPVLRWRGELTTPLVMYKQKEPNILNLHVKDGSLEVQSLNPNSGIWEPILERFRLGLDVERKAIGEDRDTHAIWVLLSGHEPVLLNVTPSTVKRLKYIMPLFIESVTSSSLVGDAENDHKTGVKYRVVNLLLGLMPSVLHLAAAGSQEGMACLLLLATYRFGSSIDLHFRSRYTKNLVASVKPSGSEWKSLDEVHGESTSSEWLSLERTGAVMLRPGAARGRLCKELGGCVAELLSPSPSHKLLFLAAPLRVHNQTDLTLVIRFHDSKRQVLQLDLILGPAPSCGPRPVFVRSMWRLDRRGTTRAAPGGPSARFLSIRYFCTFCLCLPSILGNLPLPSLPYRPVQTTSTEEVQRMLRSVAAGNSGVDLRSEKQLHRPRRGWRNGVKVLRCRW
ncbi:Chorein_N domain-containing protein [Durusdinium trenchii]|uniref:Chorein_N domain-containing protein n=1 Tax=Durusdinium trenchii TaxID=1381693 RepID=A0ABP0IHG8_9DINO